VEACAVQESTRSAGAVASAVLLQQARVQAVPEKGNEVYALEHERALHLIPRGEPFGQIYNFVDARGDERLKQYVLTYRLSSTKWLATFIGVFAAIGTHLGL